MELKIPARSRLFLLGVLVQLLFVIRLTSTLPHDYHRHQPYGSGYRPGKNSDYYGEYYRDYYGRHVYTYCFDRRYGPKNKCRPSYDHGYGHDGVLYNPGYSDLYHHYDNRGNIHVGRGHAYLRGRDMVVDCEFPSHDPIVSNIVWYKKSESSRYGGGGYRDYYPHHRSRYRVTSLGRNGSRLTIRDYQSGHDDGVYRCFATRRRRRGGRYYDYGKETVYMEIDVFTRGWHY